MPADWAGITFGLNFKNPPASNYQFWSNFLTDMSNLGCTWLRFQLDWKLIQLNQNDPPSAWSWGPLDDAVVHCTSAGINLCFPVRGEPSWTLTNPQMRTTNESGLDPQGNPYSNSPNGDGWYLPDPTMMANFAHQVALRYNGVTINPATGQSYGFIAALEFGNELYNIHDTKPNVVPHWLGIYNSPYTGLYNGINGVTQANKTQPARDMYFHASVLKTGYQKIKNASPSCLVVMGAMWWPQPANPGGVPNTPVSNYTACMQTLYAQGAKGCWDVSNVHYYSNQTAPQQGNNQCSTFSTMITDVQAVHTANGEPHKQFWCTEIGWQALIVNTTSSTSVAGTGSATITVASASNIWPNMQLSVDTGVNQETVKVTSVVGTSVTAPFTNAHSGTYVVTSVGDAPITGSDSCSSRLSYVLDTARTSGTVTKFFYFTLNYQQTVGASLSSLVQWGYNQSNPTSYVQMPTYTIYKSYIASHPSWGSTGTRVRDVGSRLNLTTGTSGRTRDIGTRLLLQDGGVGGGGGGGGGGTIPPSSLIALTDSVAQAINDYTAIFVSNSSSTVQSLATILANVSGQGTNQTMGRLAVASDPITRSLLLLAGEQTVLGLSSLVTGIESLLPFYQQFYPLMDALDNDTGGFALYLASYAYSQGFPASGIVNAAFASVFNAYASQAITLGYRDGPDTLPPLIPNWLIFPSADISQLFTFTTGTDTQMIYQMQGMTTATFGGGSAPFYLYKTNSLGASGGATFTITYVNGVGVTTTGTYMTATSLSGSASLNSGSVLLPGLAGSAILSVSGTSMTLGEQYIIGAKLVRPSAY